MKKEKVVFSKPYDAALLTYSILKRLGSGKVNSFKQRLRSQKIQYLAQLFGISPYYPFSLYIRGPYSSPLAHDLFKIKEKKIESKVSRFVPKELEENFIRLERFIRGKSNDQLELIATLHWFVKIAKLSTDEAVKRVVRLKNPPKAEMKKAVIAFNSIKQL